MKRPNHHSFSTRCLIYWSGTYEYVLRNIRSMLYIAAAGVLAVVLDPATASAQNLSPGGEQCLTPPYCSDAQRNAAGELINMDYFVAKQDSETTHLLNLVEVAHTNRVLPQISKNDYGGALSDIKYTLNRFPNHPLGLVLVGLYARLTKSYGLPVPYYEKAIRLFSQHALTHAQYGAYMVTLGTIDPGIKKLEQALEMNPELVFAHVWLAAANYKSGNLDLGRQSEARARELGYKGAVSVDSLQNIPSEK
jgi:tetratricopeptide (TPR) repeat protein